ncbi:DNA (cytosine-5-)-methyltransferase [Pseudomonas sp. PIC25]|uniref:endonuclease domain-containing protein n=1 Tax=Pseudomonas sp. PIC25 TaxID=1958773 RepID=UPI000BAB3CC4|nr:DUF559 domain-containing protein [Pseudomonas sp. PIC25]PAU53136.1 DNA (cytosine-5-)-methyltransferase [Pseudomonas sp. PIC25]
MTLTHAKDLRSRMTDAEQRLWHYLRAHRFLGLKLRRQKPMGHYIVDFVCLGRFLIIELDGRQHQLQASADAVRDRYFQERGFRVLRFGNHEVLGDTEAVLERIRLCVEGGWQP